MGRPSKIDTLTYPCVILSVPLQVRTITAQISWHKEKWKGGTSPSSKVKTNVIFSVQTFCLLALPCRIIAKGMIYQPPGYHSAWKILEVFIRERISLAWIWRKSWARSYCSLILSCPPLNRNHIRTRPFRTISIAIDFHIRPFEKCSLA